MATTLEIINGISQAAANAYDGALDDKGEPVKVGLKREEGHPILDKRVMDGFSVRFVGPMLCIHYHSELNIKEVQGDKLEGEIEQMIQKVASFLKKEYKRITGNVLALTKEGELDARVEYMSRARCWVTAHCYYKIGGIKDVEKVAQGSGERLEKDFKDWLNQETDKNPKNVDRKKEKASTFMPWNLKNEA
jgi:hypothetical protein